ncbi:hypothetical protein [Bacillus sp. SG20001]|uniref:hypothetical protein n=1 Tax=Bacillus sp. SG20001 TaxID=3074204 RepID=UPI0028802DF5|nr:hypothetical protein [Bacillus sp. SG20001]WNF51975.1 hypothetical protein RHP70_06130 [Bacillus sp. SG20001]
MEMKEHFKMYVTDSASHLHYEKLEILIDEFINMDKIKFIYSKSPFDPENAEHYIFLDPEELVVLKIEGEHNTIEFSNNKIVGKKLEYSGLRKASLTITFENGREIEFQSDDCNAAHEERYVESIKKIYKTV